MGARTWRNLTAFSLMLAGPIGAYVTAQVTPTPHGHWVGHLSNVVMEIIQLVVVLLAAVAVRSQFNVWLWLLIVLISAGLLLQAVGNLRVANSIWRTPYGDEDVWAPGVASEALVPGHDLASLGDWASWITGFAFVVALGVFRRLGLTEVVPAISTRIHRRLRQ